MQTFRDARGILIDFISTNHNCFQYEDIILQLEHLYGMSLLDNWWLWTVAGSALTLKVIGATASSLDCPSRQLSNIGRRGGKQHMKRLGKQACNVYDTAVTYVISYRGYTMKVFPNRCLQKERETTVKIARCYF